MIAGLGSFFSRASSCRSMTHRCNWQYQMEMKTCVQLGGVDLRVLGVRLECLSRASRIRWEMAAADEPILTLRGKLKKGIIP